jgi:DNA helicase II / ATP-dependent DNA helicase PcrA
LFSGSADMVIVGDDDQSIYSFKNAHPDGIKQIEQIYGPYTNIYFDTIRRCPKKVTLMASELISKNRNRSLGNLNPYENNQEGIVNIIQWGDDKKELDGLAKIIKNEIDKGLVTPGDILVLAPRRLIGYKLRDKLLAEGIAVKSYFRESVIKKESVRYAYSLLFLFAYPADRISIRYLLGFGSADYRLSQYKNILEYADKNKMTVRDVLSATLEGHLKINGVSTIVEQYRKILTDIAILKDRIIENADNLFDYFIRGDEDEIEFYELISIYQSIIAAKPLPADHSIDAVQNWFKEVMSEITESIALPDSPEEIDHVRIMSLHASKGLNSKFVILVSMIDELMPFISEEAEEEKIQKTIEEQRRLLYVAMTRCKSSASEYPGRLIISSFIWIFGVDALRMGIKANPKMNKRVSASRYIRDFGHTAPRTILGSNI